MSVMPRRGLQLSRMNFRCILMVLVAMVMPLVGASHFHTAMVMPPDDDLFKWLGEGFRNLGIPLLRLHAILEQQLQRRREKFYKSPSELPHDSIGNAINAWRKQLEERNILTCDGAAWALKYQIDIDILNKN